MTMQEWKQCTRAERDLIAQSLASLRTVDAASARALWRETRGGWQL